MNATLHRSVRIAEAVAVGVLGIFAFMTWRELSLLRQVPVALPSYQFEEVVAAGADGPVVRTRGTWVAENGTPQPLQTTTIECRKSRMECVESAAAVVFVSEKGLLEARQTVFPVARWSAQEIVSRPSPTRCAERTLILDLASKRARSEITASEENGPCKAAPARSLELVTGFQVRSRAERDARSF